LTKPLKILLGRGSPRSNIEAVEHWNQFLPCDKIIPRFVTEFKAYKMMRDYFLRHTEYTHLVLATDDIVVHPKHVDMLIDDLELHDYPVLSGMMNVETTDTQNVNLAMELPLKDRRLRAYTWMKRDELPDEQFFRVAFSGFPLMAIHRDLINQYTFLADRVFEGQPPDRGASLDLVFCYWCQKNGIPIMVDQTIDMKHLRNKGRIRTIKSDRLYFWPEDGEETQIKL